MYSGEQGHDRGMELLLQDASYDGTSADGKLHGGLGQLTDGVTGAHNFRTDLGHGKGEQLQMSIVLSQVTSEFAKLRVSFVLSQVTSGWAKFEDVLRIVPGYE